MGYSSRLRRFAPHSIATALLCGTVAAGCGSDAATSDDDRPTIVVTTNILGDIVQQSVGDLATIEVVMPLGADPHDFAPSARQAEAMERADLLVVNGEGFEEGLTDIVANVSDSGTEIFTATDHVDLLEGGHDHDHDDHGEEDHADEDHDEEHSDEDHADEDHAEDHSDEDHDDEDHAEEGHDDHDGGDPHVWTDPDRMIDVVEALESSLVASTTVDADALSASVDAYVGELRDLSARIDDTLETVPADRRVLVTNHAVFSYFAQRFGFEVIGTVIPSMSTGAEPSAAALEQLAELIEVEGTPAVFAETTTSSRLAEVLAGEVGGELAGDVVVVELFTESLGESGSGAETYVEMMSANATLIADALGES